MSTPFPLAAPRQRGVALMISLVMLVVITLVALTAIRFSTVGLRTAVNEELRVDAFEQAQSLVDAIMGVDENFDTTLALDQTNCVAGTSGCARTTLVVPEPYLSKLTSGEMRTVVRRIAPESGPMPRGVGESSAVILQGSYFQVESDYNPLTSTFDSTRGRAQLIEGVGKPIYAAGS